MLSLRLAWTDLGIVQKLLIRFPIKPYTNPFQMNLHQKKNYLEMLEASVLVVAHPDDEIIFFSSILNQVDEVIISYLKCPSKPLCTEGRRKALAQHLLKNVTCIGIEESGSFHKANWIEPEINDYGLAISNKKIACAYKENFSFLTSYFSDKLIGYKNIITHNPWGEYGHEEHVQLYRVLSQLKKSMKYNLWYSTYCSNNSFNLMLKSTNCCPDNYFTLSTNRKLAEEIAEIYKKNGCWTWYSNWEWFEEETFCKDIEDINFDRTYGRLFPINFIRTASFQKKITLIEKLIHLIKN